MMIGMMAMVTVCSCFVVEQGLAQQESGSAASVPAQPNKAFPNLKEIVVVFKTHFDIGYTHLASEAVQSYRTTMIDGALKVVDQNRDLPPEQQFVWTLPGWPMSKILEDWPGQTPQRQQRIRAAFKDGRFVTHAFPFTIQTELYDIEALVRGMGYSSRLARDAGKPLPTSVKMTDVPGHSAILPTLLTHAGVKFLQIGCNAASSSPRVPNLFWWEGPDGSRLLTMYSAAGYGTGLTPPKDWPHKTWLVLSMTGDNQGPPSPGDVKTLMEQAARELPGVKVRIGQLSDFSDRILAEKPELPVIRADMPDTWIHGPMCDPSGVILARDTVPSATVAESIHTLLGLSGVSSPAIASEFAKAYENFMLYFEHTWGGAMYWIGQYGRPKDGIGTSTNWAYGPEWKKNLDAGMFKRLQESWEEHSDYARIAHKSAAGILKGQLEALSKSVSGSGPRTVVFNPLPWKRDGVSGNLLVKDVPPMGYTTLPAAENSASSIVGDAKTGTLENTVFKIVLDPARGAIRSLVDKRSGRELVDPSAAHGFGQYLHEKFSATEVAAYTKAYVKIDTDWGWAELGKPNLPPATEVPYRALTPSNCQLEFQRGPVSVAAEMRSAPNPEGINYKTGTRVILHGDAPYVDLELTIDKPADPWPEAGWICLPFKVDAPQFRVGRAGFIMDPAKDIIPGANRHFYAVNSGVAVFGADGRGAGVCGLDTPLVSLGEPGCWKFSWDYVPTKPVVYYNLFNNQWSTNYRLWNSGPWTFRFRIWSIDRYDAESSLITPALEMRYPLQVIQTESSGGTLPPERAGLSLSRKGVEVTAFGDDSDGNKGTLLRLWEQAGVAGELTVTLPKDAGFTKASPVNLRGEKIGEPLKIDNGKFTFPLGAFAPVSFILN